MSLEIMLKFSSNFNEVPIKISMKHKLKNIGNPDEIQYKFQKSIRKPVEI